MALLRPEGALQGLQNMQEEFDADAATDRERQKLKRKAQEQLSYEEFKYMRIRELYAKDVTLAQKFSQVFDEPMPADLMPSTRPVIARPGVSLPPPPKVAVLRPGDPLPQQQKSVLKRSKPVLMDEQKQRNLLPVAGPSGLQEEGGPRASTSTKPRKRRVIAKPAASVTKRKSSSALSISVILPDQKKAVCPISILSYLL